MSQITLLRNGSTGFVQLQSNGKRPATLLCSMYNDNSNLYDVSITGAAPTAGDGLAACDLQPIRAHKGVLAHASPHLYDLFTEQGYIDSNKSKYALENIDHNSLRNIVKFIYTDSVEFSDNDAPERVRGILKGAKYLIMKDLAYACETFLASRDQIDVQNCIDVFQFAFKYKCADLLNAVCAFIAKNLLAVSESTKFLGLTQDECAKFLLSEPVVAANADDRSRAAIAWLKHESPLRAESAECIMSMAKLDAAGVKPGTLLLAAQSAVIRPTIKGFALTLIDALASNVHRTSQLELEQQRIKKQQLEEAGGEAWYVIGSFEDGRAFYRFDVARREWSTLSKLPWERKYAGVCAIDNKLIVMGGRKRGKLTAAIDEYDTVTQAWSASKAELNSARKYLAVADDSAYAYAFGGRSGSGSGERVYDVAERYSVGSRKLASLTHMNDERFGSAAVCKNDNAVFVVGGLSKCEGELFNRCTIDKYEHASQQWSKIATSKDSRCSMGIAFLGDDLYIAGGCLNEKVEILNTETGRIRLCAGELVHVRFGCSAAALDQHVFCVLGGRAEPRSAPHSSVDTYDTREGKWSVGVVVPDMPESLSDIGFAHVRL